MLLRIGLISMVGGSRGQIGRKADDYTRACTGWQHTLGG